MIAWVLTLTVAGFGIGAVLMALASVGVSAEARRERWLKFGTYFVIVHTVVICAGIGRVGLLALMSVILARGAWELKQALVLIRHRRRLATGPMYVVYVVLAGAVIVTVMLVDPEVIVFVYLTVAAFDGFSQVLGQLAGRRRLAPAVSPHKTVEGLVGGMLGSVTVAWAARALTGFSAPAALAIGTAVAACGLLGDLSASWVKRRAAIKDYSNLLPGQGGVLDRFDSFIAAVALLGPVLILGTGR